VNSAAGISDQTSAICSATAFSVSPAGVPVGTTYTWSAPVSNPLGVITGGSAQATNVSVISQTLTNTTNAQATLTYTVTPTAGGCGNGTFLVTVTVNPKPILTAQTVSICSGSSFTNTPVNNPPATLIPAGTTFSWSSPSVTGGVTGGASGSNQLSISGTLNNPTNSNQTAVYTVTPTSGAGGNCAGAVFTVTVTVNPKPIIANQTKNICTNTSFNVTPTNAAPTTIVPGGTTYSWLAPSVTGGITGGVSGTNQTSISGTLVNTSNIAETATYTVTPTSGASGNCIGNNFDVVVTVNPKPVLTATPSTLVVCSGQPLTVTLASNVLGSTYTWSSSATGNISGNTNQITQTATPSFTHTLSTTSTADVILTYTINVTGAATSLCAGDAQTVIVTVKPSVTTANAGLDQKLCSATTASFAGNNPTVGIGTWTQISGPLVTITNANSFNSSLSGLTGNNTYRFVWTIAAVGACSNSTDTVDIINRPAITIANAGIDDRICDFTNPTNSTYSLSGNLDGSRPFETGIWTFVSAANGAIINNPASPTSTVTFINAGTYELKWTISNGGACTPTSDNVIITVYDKPVAGTLNASSINICKGSSVTITNQNYTGQVQLWQYKRPYTQATWVDTLVAGATITFNNVTDTFLVRSKVVSLDFTNCTTVVYTNQIQINVAPPSVPGTTSTNKTECSGSNNGSIALSGYVGNIVRWESSTNSGTTWTTIANTSTTQTYSNLSQTTWYRAVVKSGTCNESFSTVTIITIVGNVTAPNAGIDQKLCNATTVTLLANTPASNETGTWSLVSGNPITFSATNTPTTTISGLQVGSYTFKWTIDNSICPPQNDLVDVTVYPSVINSIINTPQTICATQAITILGQLPTGGTGIFSYQWQQSSDNITWTDMVGQTNQNLTFTPASSIYVRRKVVSLPCTEFSISTFITVQPAIANNILSADQSICINNAASTIVGSVATGGNGSVTYQWQQSIDGGVTWTPINAATSKDYSPGILIITTKYRRVASTNLCFGPQGNISAVTTITVNPDAKALYTFTKDKDCAPFNINSSIIQPTIYAAQNSLYNWYANSTSIGAGTVFPGYVLSNPGDSIVIKLVAISKFGCKNDSMEHKFYSVPKPATAFTLSDTVGCGPLTVSFVNTTPSISLFTYLWNFGNGVTSTSVQPNAVIFATNPTYNDTTYIVKLNAITACETVVAFKSIRVKSKPKAIFTPDKSTGCSPMIVHFTNSSKGIGVSYIWNFDDGTPALAVATNAAQTHIFYTGVQDTFNVKLIAINECGNDTLIYKIVVAPNTVHLDFAVNGNQSQGCKPHVVSFINASSGATNFQWNFGDGNFTNTIKNVDTVNHTYLQAGTYTVTLKASNGCSDTTSTETIQVFNSPLANFTAVPLTACIGDTIHFTNQTDTATSLLWNFRDNLTSTLINPGHTYSAAGVYNVQLKAFRQYSSGLTCTDSISKPITIVSKQPGLFTVTDSISNCVPFTTTFTNLSLPSSLTSWDFGNGITATGNSVIHTFTQVGTFPVKMTALHLSGCTYEATKNIVVRGPSGTWQYDHGNICNTTSVRFVVTSNGTDSIRYNFGDGSFSTTTATTVYHNYTQAGLYVPTATLFSSLSNTCTVLLQGIDTIKIDYIKAGFKYVKQQNCGSTNVVFTDTSRHFLNISSWQWMFGDGGTSNLQNPQHIYSATNTWAIQLITTSVSGCTDTANLSVYVKVNTKPSNAIVASLQGCAGQVVNYTAQNVSVDSVSFNSWSFSNGVSVNGTPVTNTYILSGVYTATLISGTIYGCTDTAIQTITISPTPVITASLDQKICKGQSTQLNASGASTIVWTPVNGTLSCITCNSPVAAPLTTTQYIATGTNNFGCSGKDSVIITVAQPIALTISPNDTICIGQSSQLSVTGATTYAWFPAATLNNATIATPVAAPTLTTKYRVIGFDNYNCFQDTSYVTVAVGQYPTVNLGSDKILATGVQLPLTTVIANGPITKWLWGPSAASLSCTTCALPIATIKREMCYTVEAANLYKCIAKDTLCVKVFCEGSQVFIPNAFTPDGDGINDVLMVRAQGIRSVKSFRIFNRWGQIVFERNNFSPNDVSAGWDGMISGKPAPPDVYVYTCEVVCENDISYTYKGNVSILK
jgi:gliding motility-associated-like protein